MEGVSKNVSKTAGIAISDVLIGSERGSLGSLSGHGLSFRSPGCDLYQTRSVNMLKFGFNMFWGCLGSK